MEPLTTWPAAASCPRFIERHARVAFFLRLIAVWLINTCALYLLVRIVPGTRPVREWPPVATALTIAILNALLWSLLVRLLFPLESSPSVRDLQVGAVIFDMLLGRPVVYTTFLGYDEVAHHSGLERMSAIWVLRGIDRQFARIERAVRDAPRPYHFVVLADHGQSQGAPFRQRYGESQKQGTEGPSFLQASIAEVAKGRGPQAGIARLFGGLRHYRREPGQPPEVVVMASGCLGLVSFPREPGRLTLERIEALYPRLVEGLRRHPGIGFLLLRSEKYGALAMGAEGINYLDEERVEGQDPLQPFGPNAAAKVRRTDGFEHCPDIVLNSRYWKEDDEVAAFEELVGSHGGMGGSQSYPFVLYPNSWSAAAEPILGAEAMHRLLRRWLVDLGQSEHAESLTDRAARHVHEPQSLR